MVCPAVNVTGGRFPHRALVSADAGRRLGHRSPRGCPGRRAMGHVAGFLAVHRARVWDSCPLFPVLTAGASRSWTPGSGQWRFGHAGGLAGNGASHQDGPRAAACLSWLVALLQICVLPWPHSVAPPCGPAVCAGGEWGTPWGGLETSADFCPVVNAVTGGLASKAALGLWRERESSDPWFVRPHVGACGTEAVGGKAPAAASPRGPSRRGSKSGCAAGRPGTSLSEPRTPRLQKWGVAALCVQAGAWCGGTEPAVVGAQHPQGPFRPRASRCPSCERSTCPTWPHAPGGDLPGGVGRGNLVKLT